jgi:hypothetical protein
MQPNACATRKVKDDMAGRGGNREDYQPQQLNEGKHLPSEILEIVKPALQVGGLCGMSNF